MDKDHDSRFDAGPVCLLEGKDPYGLLENCVWNDVGASSIEECTWGDSRPNTFMDKLCEDMERNDRRYIRAWFDDNLTPLEFLCRTDQVGTLRAITAPNGAVVKEIRRDSFGVPYHDSFPNLHLPIGFAGGLEDPDTGLVRFGWRDYDPTIGRFTSLDPAKDRRGDGDLYDHCMDDPVSRVDPTGLWSKENFDESKVSRDGQGQFASTPGGGGGAQGAGSGSGGGGGGGDGDGVQMAASHGNATSMPGQIANRTQPSHRNFHEEPRETLELVQEQEPELSFVDALITGLGNIPASGADFVDDLCDAALEHFNFKIVYNQKT